MTKPLRASRSYPSLITILSDGEKTLARKLGISKPSTLDAAVREKRPRQEAADNSPGSEIQIADFEPWDSAVNGAQLFEDLAELIRRFVFFKNPNEAFAVAAWCIFTHCFDEFSISPYLCVHAPASECGKTTLLKVILRLARRALPSVNLSTAVMFRVIEEDRPTLIIDELAKFLEASEEFLGILLSGHERDFAFVQRCVGDEQKRKNFSTWGPKAYGIIGMPPDLQLRNRSIVIHLTRKKSDESAERWPIVNPPADFFEPFARLHRQIVRWTKDNSAEIRGARPDVSSLSNRESDNWTPLLMIAAVLGSEALRKTKSAIGDSRLGIDGDEEARLVLRDIRNIFHTRKIERMPSQALVDDLTVQDESGWNRCDDGKPLDSSYLARLLKAYDIRPKLRRYSAQEQATFQIVGKASRGYAINEFKDAFGRFLGNDAPELVAVMCQKVDEKDVEASAMFVAITKTS